MKRGLAILLLLTLLGSTPAQAHQPVELLNTDTTAAKGPLLLDGTVSFAVRASFTKLGEKRAFRADFNAGDSLAIQYLIVDKKPESALKNTLLHQLVVISPSGKSVTIKFTERTKFYEPFGKTNYLYLSRYSATSEPGTNSFTLTSRAKAAVTIAVGEREVPGGASAILFLCGKDGTNAFKAQHENQGGPAMNLSQYLLGPLAP